MPFVYEYINDIPRDFPTLGLREVKKGDRVESNEPLHSSFLKEVNQDVESIVAMKGSDE